MVRTPSPTGARDDQQFHARAAGPRNHRIAPVLVGLATRATNAVIKAGDRAEGEPESKFEDELIASAEQLIVKGKEQGYLTPGDILQGFPEIDAEPDQIFRIFVAFQEIGIEVTDGERDFEGVEQIDDEMLLDVEMMDSVFLDDPVRMYLKEIGRVSLLSANDVVVLAQAIEAKPLHDALRVLNVAEEVDGRQRNLDEMLPDIIEGLAMVKPVASPCRAQPLRGRIVMASPAAG